MITFPPMRKDSSFGKYKKPKTEIPVVKLSYKKPIIKVGKTITQTDMPFNSYKIIKVGRKYAYVKRLPSLPGIDKEIKISFYRINLEFHG